MAWRSWRDAARPPASCAEHRGLLTDPRLIARLIADGVRSGHFRPVDPGRAAAVVLGLVDGLSLQLTFDPDVFGVAEATRFADDALGRYLARPTP